MRGTTCEKMFVTQCATMRPPSQPNRATSTKPSVQHDKKRERKNISRMVFVEMFDEQTASFPFFASSLPVELVVSSKQFSV